MDSHLSSSLPYFGFVQQPGHLTLTQATVVQVHYPKPKCWGNANGQRPDCGSGVNGSDSRASTQRILS